MAIKPVEEQIRLYAKQLKIPTFGDYNDILRRIKPDDNFENILLELMKTESLQRQENQNRRRLKTAGFPFHKTLDELDLSRYEGSITE
ncbi:MAG TPA: AAA family ATPase, partial [Clostridiales bacterium]|nr:AAA family ATPase [Clostridiales bacterium]